MVRALRNMSCVASVVKPKKPSELSSSQCSFPVLNMHFYGEYVHVRGNSIYSLKHSDMFSS